MNNVQIETILSSRPENHRHFRGVFASNTLPLKPSANSSYICNLDPIQEPGSHWVAFFVPPRGPIEYFDSYGLELPPIFHHFVGSSDYITNTCFLQDPLSAVCGQYCIYYVWQRGLTKTMNKVLSIFQPDSHFTNDLLVNILIEEHYSVELKVFDIAWQNKSWNTLIAPYYWT